MLRGLFVGPAYSCYIGTTLIYMLASNCPTSNTYKDYEPAGAMVRDWLARPAYSHYIDIFTG